MEPWKREVEERLLYLEGQSNGFDEFVRRNLGLLVVGQRQLEGAINVTLTNIDRMIESIELLTNQVAQQGASLVQQHAILDEHSALLRDLRRT